ncbi:hypothetical protein CTI12_AA082330 [Artemisia annua]|uniref:Homeodomain-like protein n=1 Tax=Artemisia annua TaxID=35608 RepID=A0A2U1Q2D2_ARTAN|nr:hypothetical protein CTI12_AA082330 [Artemisia annua]
MYDQDQEELTNDDSTHTWTNDDLLLLQSELMMDDPWTKQDELLFQSALVMFPVDTEGRWEKIAERVPGKSADDVLAYHDALVLDVNDIESGCVDLPSYADDDEDEVEENNVVVKKKRGRKPAGSRSGDQSRTSQKNEKRKKGTPWSEDEHRRFLDGLNKFGKGDWRSISRNSVVTRTPTQVASHAQKFFLRQTSRTKERKRSSIHDITIHDTSMVVQPAPQPQPPPTPSPSPSPSPPLTNFYGGVEQPSTSQPTNFHGTTMVVQPPLHPSPPTPSPPTTDFYSGVQQPSTPQAPRFHGSVMVAQAPPQPTPSPSSNNFYGGTQQQAAQPAPSFNGSTMVVQPHPLATPSLPPANFYDGLQQPSTPQPSDFYGGMQQPPMSPSKKFNGGLPTPSPTNFYGDVQQPPTPSTSFHGSTMVMQPSPSTLSPPPTNVYGGMQQPPILPSTNFNGGLPPTNIHHGAQQPPTPPSTYINGGQGGAPLAPQQQKMGYEHQQHFGNPH